MSQMPQVQPFRIQVSQANPICVNCGTQHEGVCVKLFPIAVIVTDTIEQTTICAQSRQKETKFLKYKCLNFLSITDARRKYFRKSPVENFASTVQTRPSDSKQLNFFFEKRTNAMVKILHEAISQQNEKTLESVNALSELIMRLLSQLNESSDHSPPSNTEKRKKPYPQAGLDRR